MTAQMIKLSNSSSTLNPEFLILEFRIHPDVMLLSDSTVFICGGLTDQGISRRGGEGVKCADASQFVDSMY